MIIAGQHEHVRCNGLLGGRSEQILDVRYQDLVADPLATIGGLYAQWGLSLSDEAKAGMRAHIEARPQGQHGTHQYSFADTGLDLEQEQAKFAAYQERFNVPSEI